MASITKPGGSLKAPPIELNSIVSEAELLRVLQDKQAAFKAQEADDKKRKDSDRRAADRKAACQR